MTREHYLTGLPWTAYLAQMKKNRDHISALYADAAVSPQRLAEMSDAVTKQGGAISISVLTENWCGDSISVLPIIARLYEAVQGVDLRIFLGKDHPGVKERYNSDGFESIPILSFYDDTWNEFGRWVERPESANLRVDDWAKRHPELAELKVSGDPEKKLELRALYDGLLLEMAEWYRGGLWDDVVREIIEVVR